VLELPFVFDVLHLPALRGPRSLLGTASPPADLARRLHSAWVRFATTGDPGWAPQRPGRRFVQRIGTNWELVEDPRPREDASWR
jgi:para-nitrobenzyl esterase